MNHDQKMAVIQQALLGSMSGHQWREGVPWRNHYVTTDDQAIFLWEMIGEGLLTSSPYPMEGYPNARMYHATTAGIRAWLEWRNASGFGPRLYRPANAEDGESFVYLYCDRCRRDAAHRRDQDEPGCEILGRTMYLKTEDPEYPVEWLETKNGAVCTAFELDDEATP